MGNVENNYYTYAENYEVDKTEFTNTNNNSRFNKTKLSTHKVDIRGVNIKTHLT